MEINSFSQLEKYLNDNNDEISINQSFIIDMIINEDCIVFNLSFSEVWHCWYNSKVKNLWKDPRNTLLNIKATYHKPKIFCNTINLNEIADSFLEVHRFYGNHKVRFEIDRDSGNFDTELFYDLVFEYESLEFEVVGIKNRF